MHLLIAIGCEGTIDRSDLVRVVFVMNGMLLQWSVWAISACFTEGMLLIYFTSNQINCLTWSLFFNPPAIYDSLTYAGNRSRYSYERRISIRFAALCANLRCIYGNLEPQTVGACYWACSKTFCTPERVLHSSAAIHVNYRWLQVLSAVYLSLTCTSLRLSALLEA